MLSNSKESLYERNIRKVNPKNEKSIFENPFKNPFIEE